jgi:predicted hydrocarbon binding protein
MISLVNSIRFRDDVGEVEYFGQKVVLLRRDVFELIRKELSRLSGQAAKVILEVAGRRVGTEEGRALRSKAESLGLGGPESFPEFVKTAVEETNIGIGKVRVLDLGQTDDTVNVSIQNGFEAEGPGSSLKPTCFFTLGYLEGVFSQLLGKNAQGKETGCRARGEDMCRFALSLRP